MQMQIQMLLNLVPPLGQQTTSTFQVQAHALTCLLCWWATTPASAQLGPPENSFMGNKTSPTAPTVVTRDVRFDDDPPQPSPPTKLALLRNIFSYSTPFSCWWLEVPIRKVTQYQCRTEGNFKKQCGHCLSSSEKWIRAKWNLWPAEERLERGSWPSQLVLALPSWLGEHLLIISTKS